MQGLLDDPNTIPFIFTGRINLCSLKQEIDRRLLRLKALVMGYTSDPTIKETATTTCQTDGPPKEGAINNNVMVKHRRTLSSHDSNIPIGSISICQERPSLPARKNILNLNQRQKSQNGSSNRRVNVKDYLITKKVNELKVSQLISSPNKVELDEIAEVPRCHEDKNFTPIELKPKISFKIFDNSQDGSSRLHIPFVHKRLAQSPEESDADGVKSRNSFSTIGRKVSTVRKLKFTDRTALPESDNARIIVSEACIKKIEEQLAVFMAKKRKELVDNKLRQNVIKKVEEKYGEYYEQL